MGLNQHDDHVDARITRNVQAVMNEVLDYEYRIIEDLQATFDHGCCRLVEIGCGALGVLGRDGDRLAALQPHSIGIDIDLESLAWNSNVSHRVCATSYALPLKTESVDLIVCRWMFEHLEVPERALREFARVLKPGGFLYMKTPNLWNYAMLISWLTPTAFHNFFRSATGHGENIPTFYRANTRRRLKALAARSGFAVRRAETHSYSFMYYKFNRELFLLMRSLSRLLGKITDRTQLMLCCVLEKV